MLKARPAKEIVLRMPNAIGTLHVLAKALAEKGINIVALTGWVEGEVSEFATKYSVVIRSRGLMFANGTRAFTSIASSGSCSSWP